jgi:hypothetical protein
MSQPLSEFTTSTASTRSRALLDHMHAISASNSVPGFRRVYPQPHNVFSSPSNSFIHSSPPSERSFALDQAASSSSSSNRELFTSTEMGAFPSIFNPISLVNQTNIGSSKCCSTFLRHRNAEMKRALDVEEHRNPAPRHAVKSRRLDLLEGSETIYQSSFEVVRCVRVRYFVVAFQSNMSLEPQPP